jgi:hypothetical protein
VTSAYRYARTYLRIFSNLNAMVHVLLFNMKANVIMNVTMYVICRKRLKLLGRLLPMMDNLR